MKKVIKKYSEDNVATALANISCNEIVTVISDKNEVIKEIQTMEAIPFGNKIAIIDIKKDDKIIKYGFPIGVTTKNIDKGRLVHVHNVKSQRVDIPNTAKKMIIEQMGIKVD
ncbi:SAF domain-containing protein [Clostridiaceae bacterium M8S5]|nr:SAF domain-containing protein [Clostridiaceae bacterium M8S5]